MVNARALVAYSFGQCKIKFGKAIVARRSAFYANGARVDAPGGRTVWKGLIHLFYMALLSSSAPDGGAGPPSSAKQPRLRQRGRKRKARGAVRAIVIGAKSRIDVLGKPVFFP